MSHQCLAKSLNSVTLITEFQHEYSGGMQTIAGFKQEKDMSSFTCIYKGSLSGT
jgi:hypothetical protein